MPLSWNEIRQNAIAFSHDWADAARERAEAQTFWNEFFEIFGVRRRTVASFEAPVHNLVGNFDFIDLLWPGTLIAEHKSRGGNLSKAESQAMAYIRGLMSDDRRAEVPRYIVVSDFARIALHDLETDDTIEFPLDALHENLRAFGFIAGYRTQIVDPEDPANIEAATLLARLYDTLKAGGYPDHDVERFMVRVLFCMFAEDTGLLGQPDAFRLYIENTTRDDGADLGLHLGRYFEILNTPPENRQRNLDEQLADLPYVNGELFADQLPGADFNRDMRNQLLICCSFRWDTISPAVFGSLFQSIMQDKERRQIGAHYTSERDILKLIRSLFLDQLYEEFERAKNTSKPAIRRFHEKLGSLKFLDPACGCGNFLVIAYRELRDLEIKVLEELHAKTGVLAQPTFNLRSQLVVDIDQMHGIEIEEWPARIAEVAMWLMDHQMNLKISDAFGQSVFRLPLDKSAHITCANALRTDWNDVLPAAECDYVLGNPPFVGHHLQTPDQKSDQNRVWHDVSARGVLDYVTCWYRRAAEYIAASETDVAFVSTNSITQGEQPGIFWHVLLRLGLKIRFAHRTFYWTSEARGKAHVHVVIIGFGHGDARSKTLWEYEHEDGARPTRSSVRNISPYLFEGADVLLSNRAKPICDVPGMRYGNKPTDGGFLILSAAEREELLVAEPGAATFVRPYLGAAEFLNGRQRWCLWLQDIQPSELRALPRVAERVAAVRAFRLASKAASTRKYADYPTLFRQISQPDTAFILVPGHTSESRRYIPMAHLSPEHIVSNACFLIPNAGLWHLGVLSSAMHMAWVRQFCGRIKSDYRYSKDIVYNNFPWPQATTAVQQTRVEEAAQAVCDARAAYPDASLADLYDPVAMPPPLRKAHERLDRAVDVCYRRQRFVSERNRIEILFTLYEAAIAPLGMNANAPRQRARSTKSLHQTDRPS